VLGGDDPAHRELVRRYMTTPRRQGRQAGQGITEFALVIPLILMLFFGIFDLGRAVYAYSTISNAARDSARVAIVNQADSTDCVAHPKLWRCTAAREAVGLGIDPTAVSIWFCSSGELCETDPAEECTANADGSVPIGCDVVIKVPYTYTAATPLISTLVGTVSMYSTERLAVEYSHVNLNP
jgi:hypothetical protein